MTDFCVDEWFEVCEGNDLQQGDILHQCPVFRPPPGLDLAALEGNDAEVEFAWEKQDAIVISQSCDIASNQKSGMWLVALCPVWSVSQVCETNTHLKSNTGLEECRRGYMNGYFLLPGYDRSPKAEMAIVSFREIFSLQLELARHHAETLGDRLRLRSPYREHLSQAFAHYFMRVALPKEIPRFPTEEDVEKTLRRAFSLTPEQREHVMSVLQKGE